MKFKKIMVWSAIQGKAHPQLSEKEQKIEGFMPLVKALFPGVNYYSITGFNEVMSKCVIPALKKRFPELQPVAEGDLKNDEMVEVEKFLPSKGYEWQDSTKWQSKFQKLLVA